MRDLFGEESAPEPAAPAEPPPEPVAGLEDDVAQSALFDLDELEWWRNEWVDMPEFSCEDVSPHSSITVHFRNDADRRAFLLQMGEKPERVKSIWFPRMEYLEQSARSAPATVVPPNRYPVYVISKGRADTSLTARALDKLGIAHHVVIEPQERDQYAAVMDPAKLLLLPFSNLGQGSIPARNWVWEHALASGAERHWILDDNMDGFYRLNHNLKTKVIDENPFTPVEVFADRYTNVALAGMNYEFFVSRREKQPPFRLNTRIYSCILIKNDLPYRWRGRYNEDTDLSIRALKDGYVTVLFNAYSCKKMPTMTMGGGNTDQLYQGNGRLQMAESLVEQHPDVARVSEKWGRAQHHVDYTPFRYNKLVRRTL